MMMAQTNDNSLAIIGAACYLPGAVSLEDYWSGLFHERISIEVPGEDRFDPDFYSAVKGKRGHSYSNLAATVDIEEFCRTCVPKMEREFVEAGNTTSLFPHAPGHLLALYTAMEALRSAGMDPFRLGDSRIGTFCGLVHANNHYERETPIPGLECLTDLMDGLSSFAAIPLEKRDRIKSRLLSCGPEKEYASWAEKYIARDEANQLVRFIQTSLGMEGTAFCFDSACSSSLLSLELARNYLKEEKIDAAIAGGMTWFTSGGFVHFANASANSAKGAFPFEDRADGLVPGEGCSFSIVKLLDRALADGDRILGVIRGIGISSDGRGKSLWAPSSEGQTLAIRRAFDETGWESYDGIDYVEAHATSTQLGDATELIALSDAMESHISPDRKIPITSVKANIGHTLESAGMASLQKVLLSMEHETILRQPYFQTASSKFDWARSHFRVPLENIPWKQGKPRRALVEAFGIGGLNAQVALEGPESARPDSSAAARDGQEEPIAIIGTGCVLPGAFDVPAFYRLLDSGQSAIRPLSPDRPNILFPKREKEASDFAWAKYPGGYVDGYEYDWRRHRIPPKHIKYANPLQFMILGAVDEAVVHAGYRSSLQAGEDRKRLDSETTAVVVGTSTNSDFREALMLILSMPMYERRLRRILLDEGFGAAEADGLVRDFADAAYEVYPVLQDETGGFTVSTLASRITKTYDLKGGGFTLDAGEVSAFVALENGMQLLRRHARLTSVLCAVGQRKMDTATLREGRANGTAPGEGAVAFFLKRLSDAQRDGDTVLAVVRDVRGGFVGRDAKRSLEALDDAFHRHTPETTGPSKTLYGTTLDDGIAKTSGDKVLALRSVLGDMRHVTGAAQLLAAIHQFDSTGISNAVVTQLDREGMFYRLFVEKTYSGPVPQKTVKVEKIMSQTPTSAPRDIAPETNSNTIPFTKNRYGAPGAKRCDRDKVVFMFPGQGSQYKMMMASLLAASPELRGTLAEFDTVLRKLEFPDFDDLTVKNAALLGKDVFRTQLALLVADSLFAKYFENGGILPDIVLGHSYGEYPAMVASGVWSFETAAWTTWQRCRIIEQCLMKDASSSPNNIELFDRSSATTMLSTNASAEQLHKLFEELWEQTVSENSLFISNRNAPDQMIVSGTRKALVRLEAELKSRKFSAIILPVPAAYHSPLVKEVCEPLREVAEKVYFSVPKIAMLSSVTMRFEADPDQFRSNLAEQMVCPVDFVRMIQKAYANGGRFFVEVGTKRVLEKLASKILAGCKDVEFYHCDNGKGGAIDEFNALGSKLHEIRRRITSYASAGIIQIDGLNVELEDGEREPGISDRIAAEPVQKESYGLLKTAGTPYELGYQYGQAQSENIRRTLRRYADMALTPQNSLLVALTPEVVARAEVYFGKDGRDELYGMAKGAGVPYEALLRHNLSVFPVEHVDALAMLHHRHRAKKSGCVQFAGRLANGDFVHGGNIDIAFTRIIPDSLQYALVVRRPLGKIASVSVVPTGLVGSRGGVNARGISVTTCDLLDEEFGTTNMVGFRRGCLVQTILDDCATLDDVERLVRSRSDLCGAKSLCVGDTRTGRILLLENVGREIKIVPNEQYVVQANHSLLFKSGESESGVPKHSLARYRRLRELLRPSQEGTFAPGAAEIAAVLRDTKDDTQLNMAASPAGRYRTMNMILRVDNAFSWLYNARTMTMSLCLTLSPYFEENQRDYWRSFDIRQILPDFAVEPVRKVTTPEVQIPETQSLEENKPEEKTPEEKLPEAPVVAAPVSEVRKQSVPNTCIVTESEFFQGNDSSVYLKEKSENAIERFVPRLQETRRLPDGSDPAVWRACVKGAFLIVGNSPVAAILTERLRGAGIGVFVYDPASESGDPEERVGALWAQVPITYVVFTNPEDADYAADPRKFLAEKFEKTHYAQLQICRRLTMLARQAGRLDRLGFAVLTRFGGDFGFGGKVTSPLGGFTSGMLKGLRDELHVKDKVYLPIKAIDHAEHVSPDELVADVLSEIRAELEAIDCGANTDVSLVDANDVARTVSVSRWNPFDNETGYLDGQRRVVRTVAQSSDDAPVHAGEKRGGFLESLGGVWIVTGGLRGITSALTCGLVKKARPDRLYLVGSAPYEPVDDTVLAYDARAIAALRMRIMRDALTKNESPMKSWKAYSRNLEMTRNLAAFKEMGIDVVYVVCDTRKWDAIEAFVREIESRSERVSALVCGAGVQKDESLEKLNHERADNVILTKIVGLAAFLNELRAHPLKLVVGFGSVSGRFGGNGQIPYTAACDMTAKTILQYRGMRPECRAFCVEWGVWGDIGMSAQIDTKGTHAVVTPVFLTKETGVPLFVNEFENGLNEPETLFAPWKYYKRFQPDGIGATSQDVPETVRPAAVTATATTTTAATQIAGSRPCSDWLIDDGVFRNQREPEPETIDGVGRLTFRYVDRIVEIPKLPEVEPVMTREPVLLIGSRTNRFAEKLAERIAACGGVALRFSPRDADGAVKEESVVRSEIESLFRRTPFYSVFILDSYESDEKFVFDRACWNSLRNVTYLTNMFVVQQWYRMLLERKELSRLRIQAATRAGGGFAFSTETGFPGDGALVGMLHGIRGELATVTGELGKCRLIDFATDAPLDTAVETFLREYTMESTKESVYYRENRRYLLRMVRKEIRQEFELPKPEDGKKPVWIVTGGCRGVNAKIALGLGTRFSAKLHLVGSTPIEGESAWAELDERGIKELRAKVVKETLAKKGMPAKAWQQVEKQIEVQKNLKDFRDAGIDFQYHVCDLVDADATGTLVDSILRTEGRIDGILFGAGFERAASLEKKTPDVMARTLDVKVGSAFAILERLKDRPPKIVVGMGSLSGRVGSVGQVDYCTCNALLGKILEAYATQYDDCRSLVVHWQAWGDVGMAVRPESKLVFHTVGMAWMPAKEGVRHLLDEVAAQPEDGRWEKEVSYTEWSNYVKSIGPTAWPPYQLPQGISAPVASAEVASAEVIPCEHSGKSAVESVFGTNAEARFLRRHGDDSRLNDTFVFTTPCDPSQTRIRQKAQLELRDLLAQAGVKSLEKWLLTRKNTEDNGVKPRIVIVKDSRLVNPIKYDEAEILREKAERLCDRLALVGENRPEIVVADYDIGRPVEAVFDALTARASLPSGNTDAKEPRKTERTPMVSLEPGDSTVKTDKLEKVFVLNPAEDTFLRNHQLNTRPIVPFVIVLEAFYDMARGAGRIWNESGTVELRNVRAIRGFVCDRDVLWNASCEAGWDDGTKLLKLRFNGDFYNKAGVLVNRKSPYFMGEAAFVAHEPCRRIEFPPVDGTAYMEPVFPTEGNRDGFYHGPVLQQLGRCHFVNEETLVASVSVPDKDDLIASRRDRNFMMLDAAVLDAGFWACGVLNGYTRKNVDVIPDRLGALKFGTATLTAGSVCRLLITRTEIRSLPGGYWQVVFNLRYCNERNEVVYELDRFQMTELPVKRE